jgi:hypothetical protein
MDKNNAIDMCKEVLKTNHVDLSTVGINKRHDPIINIHLTKEEEPEVVYMAYVAKTISGYVVRLVFRANEYFEIEEDFMTIMYEGDD